MLLLFSALNRRHRYILFISRLRLAGAFGFIYGSGLQCRTASPLFPGVISCESKLTFLKIRLLEEAYSCCIQAEGHFPLLINDDGTIFYFGVDILAAAPFFFRMGALISEMLHILCRYDSLDDCAGDL